MYHACIFIIFLTDLEEGAHKLNIKKTRKIPKDPAIKEGNPLANDGACKHYKKSFRWLRYRNAVEGFGVAKNTQYESVINNHIK